MTKDVFSPHFDFDCWLFRHEYLMLEKYLRFEAKFSGASMLACWQPISSLLSGSRNLTGKLFDFRGSCLTGLLYYCFSFQLLSCKFCYLKSLAGGLRGLQTLLLLARVKNKRNQHFTWKDSIKTVYVWMLENAFL